MISQENETSELVITPELLGTLSIPALVELLLHRSNLFSATSRTQLSDENYTSNLQKEITAIHDEYLFYKMAALYFKHIKKADKENTSNVHSAAAQQRFLVLEWLLNPDNVEWDELIELFNEEE